MNSAAEHVHEEVDLGKRSDYGHQINIIVKRFNNYPARLNTTYSNEMYEKETMKVNNK